MDIQTIFVIIAALLVLVGSCVGFVSQRRRQAEIELRAPLLNDETSSADAHVASALRTAREGFRVCPKCSFENLSRRAFCAICSAAFTGDGKSKRKPPATPLTTRQKRVRRRRQWMRGVTEDGKVYWQWTSDDVSSSTAAGDAMGLEPWVLRMHAPGVEPAPSIEEQAREESSAAETSTQASGETDEAAVNATSPNHVSIEIRGGLNATDREQAHTTGAEAILAQTAAALQASAAQLTVSVEDATTADAAVPSLVLRSLSPNNIYDDDQRSQEICDTAAQARLDFPTKLAQFITTTMTLFQVATAREDGQARASRFTIDRASLLRDSIAAIAEMTPAEARAVVRVDFVGDQGVDAGGVYREWFLLLNAEIAKPEAGVFTCVDANEQTFYLNPRSREVLGERHLAHVFAAGRLLGRALLDGNVTGFHLAQPLLKLILGLPVGFRDLEGFDPETHKSLSWLLHNDGVDTLGLDFSVVERLPDGSTRVVELVPGGCEMDVTDANKLDFVARKMQYLLVDSVAPQLLAFLKGLYEVVPPELLMLFDAEELDVVLSGSDAIDVDDWQRHTKYTADLVDHPALKHFWQLVREMTAQERRRLLQFATGSSRVPPAGFAALSSFDGRLCPFTLHGVGGWEDGGYVRSHACFNRLDLPRHQTKKGLQRALGAALLSDEMETGFTMQ